jgi:2'-5' RNA ligase
MPRFFAALEIPKDVAQSLSLLRGGLQGARWIDVENYHLTLRFIGDVDERTADDVLDAFDHVSKQEFELQLSGINVFGSKKPRALYANVTANETLNSLQASIDSQCRRIGIMPDGRKFTPHIALARLRHTNHYALRDYLDARSNFKSRTFNVEKFVVMSSKNSRGGGPYIIEERYLLGANNNQDHLASSFSTSPEQPSSNMR